MTSEERAAPWRGLPRCGDAAMGSWKVYSARTCAVLAAILLPLAIIGLWAREVILDESVFVSTFSAVWDDPNVQSVVSDRIVEVAKERRPDMGPVTQAALVRTADQVIASSAFEKIWEDVLRLAHQGISFVWTGEGEKGIVSTDDGVISIDLAPVMVAVTDGLQKEGVTLFTGDNIPSSVPVEIVSAEKLKPAHQGLVWLNRLAYVLPVIAAIFVALALYLAALRWRMLFWMSLGGALSVGLTMIAVAIARSRIIDAPKNDVSSAFVSVVLDEALRPFWIACGAVILVTVVAAVAARVLKIRQSPAVA